MPIYEFVCHRGHVTEKLFSSIEAAPKSTLCEHVTLGEEEEVHCCALANRKQFSVPAPMQFGEGKKGSAVGEAIKRVKAKGL